MRRATFIIRMDGDRSAAMAAVKALEKDFAAACEAYRVKNFSLWQMEEYLFGYGECESESMACFDSVLGRLPEGARLICKPGEMPMMYHDLGVVREDKSLIRHRVFATRLKPNCAEEYKRRHDGLVAARKGKIVDHAESNFTIWHGDGCIFGYCELVKAFDHEPTAEEHAATVAWETRQLEIMDWLTDDMDWLTGEKHAPVVRLI